MFEAIKQAKKAYDLDEVPIGCVIVKDNKIIARAYNKRNSDKIANHHAEMLAIEKACKKLGDWRLGGCSLYVTLEPCPMCAGACYNARIAKIIYGTIDEKSGAFSACQMQDKNLLNHKLEIVGGECKAECKKLLNDFFANKR